MKRIFILLLAIVQVLYAGAQTDKDQTTNVSPYKTSWAKDAAITGGGIGLTVLGYSLITHKDDLTLTQLATKTRDKVPFFDRGNVGYYSERADKDSYIPFNASFGYPILLMLVNGNERHHVGQVAALYLETMSIAGSMFTLSARLI